MRFNLLILLFSLNSHAAITAGVGLFSWQERVIYNINDNKLDANASFTSFGPIIGNESLLSLRYRGGVNIYYHSGVADVLKVDGALPTRHNFKSIWFSGKVLYRVSTTFAVGPNVFTSQKQMQNLPDAVTGGIFLNFEYDIFDQVRLIQSLGTLGDRGLLAYSFMLNRSF